MAPNKEKDPTDLVAARIVRQLRQDLGLTQHQLAERSGLSQSVVSEYETGSRQPSLGALIRLVESCGKELRTRLGDRDRQDDLLASCYPAGTLAAFAAEQDAILRRRTVERIADEVFGDLVAPDPVTVDDTGAPRVDNTGSPDRRTGARRRHLDVEPMGPA